MPRHRCTQSSSPSSARAAAASVPSRSRTQVGSLAGTPAQHRPGVTPEGAGLLLGEAAAQRQRGASGRVVDSEWVAMEAPSGGDTDVAGPPPNTWCGERGDHGVAVVRRATQLLGDGHDRGHPGPVDAAELSGGEESRRSSGSVASPQPPDAGQAHQPRPDADDERDRHHDQRELVGGHQQPRRFVDLGARALGLDQHDGGHDRRGPHRRHDPVRPPPRPRRDSHQRDGHEGERQRCARLEETQAGEQEVPNQRGRPVAQVEQAEGHDVEDHEACRQHAAHGSPAADRSRKGDGALAPAPATTPDEHDAGHHEAGERHQDRHSLVPATFVGEEQAGRGHGGTVVDGEPGRSAGRRTTTGGRSRLTCGRRRTLAFKATSRVHDLSMLRITATPPAPGEGRAAPRSGPPRWPHHRVRRRGSRPRRGRSTGSEPPA